MAFSRIKSIVRIQRKFLDYISNNIVQGFSQQKKWKQVSRLLLQVNMEIYTKEELRIFLYMAKSSAYFTLHSTSAPKFKSSIIQLQHRRKCLDFYPFLFPRSFSLVLITKARHVCWQCIFGKRITHSLSPKKKNSAYTRWLSTWYLRLFSGWIPPWTSRGKGLSVFPPFLSSSLSLSLWSFEHSLRIRIEKERRRKITSKESSVWQQQQKQYIYCFKLTHQKEICGIAGCAHSRLVFCTHASPSLSLPLLLSWFCYTHHASQKTWFALCLDFFVQ